MLNKTILLTGATGFVGKALVSALHAKELRLLSRKDPQQTHGIFCQAEIDSSTDYSAYLDNVDVVIHTAARVHVMDDRCSDPLVAYREVNTEGTVNLARQAAMAGVKRFIYISSIKVNGESTELGLPFKPDNAYIPTDPYAQSKYEAEFGLRKIAEETGLEVVIIRPTLVYGPGVKANFASLLNLVSKGIPLPFGCITQNKRSLVSVTNLVDLIITCIEHPKAANQVFLVSDDNDVSTASMVKEMSKSLGKPNCLFPLPLWCFHLVGKLTGKTDVVDRLLGSLQVDITHTKETLCWEPLQTLEDGFKETAEAFFLNHNK